VPEEEEEDEEDVPDAAAEEGGLLDDDDRFVPALAVIREARKPSATAPAPGRGGKP
jgi:hypothetical protein